MERRLVGRSFGDIFSAPEQLDHAEGKVGEVIRRRRPPGAEERLERARIRRAGQRRPMLLRKVDNPRPAFG